MVRKHRAARRSCSCVLSANLRRCQLCASRRKLAESTQEQERLAVTVSPLNVQADLHQFGSAEQLARSSALYHTDCASPAHELSFGIPISTTPSFDTSCSPLTDRCILLHFGFAHMHHAGNKCQPHTCCASSPCVHIFVQQLTSISDFPTVVAMMPPDDSSKLVSRFQQT